jgi:hypothetical protein
VIEATQCPGCRVVVSREKTTGKRRDPNSIPANEPLWSNVVPFTF